MVVALKQSRRWTDSLQSFGCTVPVLPGEIEATPIYQAAEEETRDRWDQVQRNGSAGREQVGP